MSGQLPPSQKWLARGDFPRLYGAYASPHYKPVLTFRDHMEGMQVRTTNRSDRSISTGYDINLKSKI